MRSEWREIRLGDLVNQGALSISDGYRVRNEELGPVGIPFVRGGDIGDGWIRTATVDHIRPEFADRVRVKLAGPGDVAFITKGTVGRAGLLRSGQPPVVFAPQVAYWRVLEPKTLDGRFLFYLIQSQEFQAALDGVKTHGSMVADYVSISLQHDFIFRFPDIRTQRAIADILGALDDKIELNRRMNTTLEAIVRATFKSWFVDFDPVRSVTEGRDPALPPAIAAHFPASLEESEFGQIPEGWGGGTIACLMDRVIEKVVDAANWQNEHLIDLSRMPQSCIALAEWGIGAELGTSVIRFQARDTLFGAIRPYFHKVGIAPVNGVTNISVFVLRAKRSADWPFTAILCSMNQIVDFASRVAKGTKMPVVSWADFARCPVPLVPPALRDIFNHFAAPFLDRILCNIHEAQTLAAVKNALLPKLLSGKLSIGDAERHLEAAL